MPGNKLSDYQPGTWEQAREYLKRELIPYVRRLRTGVGPPGPPGPAGPGFTWEDVYEPDLLGHPSFTYSSDGESHTVDSVPWIAGEVTGAGSTLQFINGTGFRIRPGAPTVYGSGTGFNSAPYVEMPLGAVFQAAGIGGILSPIRVQFRFTLTNTFNTDFQFAFMGFAAETTDDSWRSVIALAGHNGTPELRAWGAFGAKKSDAFARAFTTEDVAEVRLDAAFSGDVRFGVYSSGFPDIPDADVALFRAGTTNNSLLSEEYYIVSGDAATHVPGSQFGSIIIAAQQAGGGPFDLTISHLRVQQLRGPPATG